MDEQSIDAFVAQITTKLEIYFENKLTEQRNSIINELTQHIDAVHKDVKEILGGSIQNHLKNEEKSSTPEPTSPRVERNTTKREEFDLCLSDGYVPLVKKSSTALGAREDRDKQTASLRTVRNHIFRKKRDLDGQEDLGDTQFQLKRNSLMGLTPEKKKHLSMRGVKNILIPKMKKKRESGDFHPQDIPQSPATGKRSKIEKREEESKSPENTPRSSTQEGDELEGYSEQKKRKSALSEQEENEQEDSETQGKFTDTISSKTTQLPPRPSASNPKHRQMLKAFSKDGGMFIPLQKGILAKEELAEIKRQRSKSMGVESHENEKKRCIADPNCQCDLLFSDESKCLNCGHSEQDHVTEGDEAVSPELAKYLSEYEIDYRMSIGLQGKSIIMDFTDEDDTSNTELENTDINTHHGFVALPSGSQENIPEPEKLAGDPEISEEVTEKVTHNLPSAIIELAEQSTELTQTNFPASNSHTVLNTTTITDPLDQPQGSIGVDEMHSTPMKIGPQVEQIHTLSDNSDTQVLCEAVLPNNFTRPRRGTEIFYDFLSAGVQNPPKESPIPPTRWRPARLKKGEFPKFNSLRALRKKKSLSILQYAEDNNFHSPKEKMDIHLSTNDVAPQKSNKTHSEIYVRRGTVALYNHMSQGAEILSTNGK